MRIFRPPLRFWTWSLVAALILCVVATYLAFKYMPKGMPEQELVKVALQALFAALFGGILATFLNARRDEDQRDMARDAAVREIVEEMHTVHRKLKMVKRRLRSQMSPPSDRLGGIRALPYTVPVELFERAMDDLLAAQIETEQVRDSVRARDDLISTDRIARVHKALHYAARYAHDVYQGFEDCTVSRADGMYHIDQHCTALVDFLGRRAWDGKLPPAAEQAMTASFNALKDQAASVADRYAALDRIETLRKQTQGKPRYRIVATECIALAAADLQRSVRRERWRVRAQAALQAHAARQGV